MTVSIQKYDCIYLHNGKTYRKNFLFYSGDDHYSKYDLRRKCLSCGQDIADDYYLIILKLQNAGLLDAHYRQICCMCYQDGGGK